MKAEEARSLVTDRVYKELQRIYEAIRMFAHLGDSQITHSPDSRLSELQARKVMEQLVKDGYNVSGDHTYMVIDWKETQS